MKVYSAHDYLAAFEPWLLEDLSALPGILVGDTHRAEKVAYRLLMPMNADGKYPVEVWVAVHPLVKRGSERFASCRREKSRVGQLGV
jgi:hypothetical protein